MKFMSTRAAMDRIHTAHWSLRTDLHTSGVDYSYHGHELAACAAMGYPMSLSRYLDPYPVLFHGVSVSQ